MSSWLAERQQIQDAGMECAGNMVSVDPMQIRHSVKVAPATEDFNLDVRSEVVDLQIRQGKIAQQEEIDDFEARESTRMKKVEAARLLQSGGRPKKLMSEMLEQVVQGIGVDYDTRYLIPDT